MYRTFKTIAQDLGLKGWRFDLEGEERFYLSKFDEVDGNNEYRFYFFINNDSVQIVRRIMIIRYKYKETVDVDHKYYQEARKILETYFDNYVANTN